MEKRTQVVSCAVIFVCSHMMLALLNSHPFHPSLSSNRKFWASLKLLDARDVTTNQGMYDKCIHHLTKAMASGSSEAYVTVFKPKTAEDKDGPRIWNDQLLSYASYKIGGEDVGDPKNVRVPYM